MKMIQAIIQPEKMDKVKKALEETGFVALIILKITGDSMAGGFTPSPYLAQHRREYIPAIVTRGIP